MAKESKPAKDLELVELIAVGRVKHGVEDEFDSGVAEPGDTFSVPAKTAKMLVAEGFAKYPDEVLSGGFDEDAATQQVE
jgi:hypothetical protein